MKNIANLRRVFEQKFYKNLHLKVKWKILQSLIPLNYLLLFYRQTAIYYSFCIQIATVTSGCFRWQSDVDAHACVKWYFEERNCSNHSCAVSVKPKAQKCGRHTTSRNFLQASLLTNLWLRTKISTLTNQIKKIMTFVCIVVKLTYLSKLTCNGAIRHIRLPKLKSIRSRNYNTYHGTTIRIVVL